jgi:hypothetical protein
MGSSSWIYFIPYQENIGKAFQELRQSIFESGYYVKMWEYFGQESIILKICEERGVNYLEDSEAVEIIRDEIGPIYVESPKTIEETLARSEGQGTHSILDIRRFSTETSPYVGVPLSEEFIRAFFVHEAVTKEVIETIITAKEVWSGVQNVIDHQIRTRKSVPQFLRKNLLSEEVLQFFEVKRTIQELIRDLYEQQNIWNELHELVVSLIEGIAYYYRRGAAIPFSEKVLLQFFNTLKPTKEMAEAIFEQGTIWEAIPTGMGYYTILYQNEKPNGIVFAGFSGD